MKMMLLTTHGCFTTTKIPQEQQKAPSSLNCLRGLPLSGINKVPKDSVYGRLPRSPYLPRLHSAESCFDRQSIKNAFMSMFNGEFTVHWREEKDCLVLLGFVGFVDDDSLWGPLIRVTVSGTIAADPQVEDCTKSYFRILKNAFKGALTEGQRDTIAYRVLHRFLRAKGASLQADMADIACVQLKTNYSATSKRWKEGLDATIMTADIAINKDCSNERAARLFAYVGEYLEASGRFMEGANLYDEAARVYVPNSTSAVFHYSYAGLAHK